MSLRICQITLVLVSKQAKDPTGVMVVAVDTRTSGEPTDLTVEVTATAGTCAMAAAAVAISAAATIRDVLVQMALIRSSSLLAAALPVLLRIST